MNKLTFIIRSVPGRLNKVNTPYLYLCGRQYSSKGDDEDNTNKSESKQKSQDALKKLNLLLKQMVEEDVITNSKLELAKPKTSHGKIVVKTAKKQPAENQIVSAAQDVAKSLGGDVKQTESELLTKLLKPISAEKSDKETISATLSEVMKGMKIDRESKQSEETSRANQVRSILQTERRKAQKNNKEFTERSSYRRNIRADRHDTVIQKEKIDLFGSEPLGIFSLHETPQNEMNKTWKMLHERELHLAVTHPPSNYFQQMILWTQQGKIWKFPIDNEQGMEEEQSIYFAEHIFLEKHLEQWCPPRGPIRHFMELVCVGLSKNPYMSVQHKKEHIEWYRDYFNDKRQLLEEVGALQLGPKVNEREKQDNVE